MSRPLLTVTLQRHLRAAAREVDFVPVLSLVAALFSVARAGCFLNLRPEVIQDVPIDRVRFGETQRPTTAIHK